MNPYLIRRMKDEDVLAVSHVDAIAGIRLPWSPGAYWEELRKKTTWCWVAESITDDELEYVMPFPAPFDDVVYAAGELIIIGSVTMWKAEYKFHIVNISVHPTCANRGVGRSLMEKAISYARERGGTEICLQVREHNPRARHLYESFGFIAYGIRPSSYTWDDNYILMSAPILKTP